VSERNPDSEREGLAVVPTDYTLRTGYLAGQKVATLESVRGAALAMAADYERDGEHDCAVAFRLFADSLKDRPRRARA